MKVLLLSRYGRQGASSRLRSYQYLPYLAEQGIEINVRPLMDDDYVRGLQCGRRAGVLRVAVSYMRRVRDVLGAGGYHLVWLEREFLPWLPAWVPSLLRRRGIPYVVDYDDAVFHRYDQHRSGLVRLFLGRKIDCVMRQARIVIAGNSYLANRAQDAGAERVEIIPTVIDLARYTAPPASVGMGFTIGWIGSPTTASYLQEIVEPLNALADSGARIALIGAPNGCIRGLAADYIPWTEDSEIELLHRCDVGIMPLPDTPWTRGKCGLKLIQYMGVRLPVVASPVGANRDIVVDGVTGLFAEGTDDWWGVLNRLRECAELRRSLGEAGRRRVEQFYCLDVTSPVLAALLREAAMPSGRSRGGKTSRTGESAAKCE